MYKILTLNNISVAGLERLPRETYEVASEIQHPDGILLRSYNMHDMDIPESVQAIGRAGAGVNNIPVDKLSARGVPVSMAWKCMPVTASHSILFMRLRRCRKSSN